MTKLDDLADRIEAVPYSGLRRVIAIAGAPASGKSTLANRLSHHVAASCVVPMDGFHLDNAVLDARGLRSRKGSPPTFDLAGFAALMSSLKTEEHVSYPLFDRDQDRAIQDAGTLSDEVSTVLVEGNYLLLKGGGWQGLRRHWDMTIYLDVPMAELQRRLLARWTELGFSQDAAHGKMIGNDLPNAQLVVENSFEADIRIAAIAARP